MMFALLAAELNRRVEVEIGRSECPAYGERFSLRLSVQNNCFAFLENFVPEFVWEPQRRGKRTDDRRLAAPVGREQHCGPMPKFEERTFPATLAQRFDPQRFQPQFTSPLA